MGEVEEVEENVVGSISVGTGGSTNRRGLGGKKGGGRGKGLKRFSKKRKKKKKINEKSSAGGMVKVDDEEQRTTGTTDQTSFAGVNPMKICDGSRITLKI